MSLTWQPTYPADPQLSGRVQSLKRILAPTPARRQTMTHALLDSLRLALICAMLYLFAWLAAPISDEQAEACASDPACEMVLSR